MRTSLQVDRELRELVAAHYYSEEFELLAAARAYQQQLREEERDLLRAVVLRRLFDDGSLVDVLLCSVVHVPSAAPVLAARLDREAAPSQLTRALIAALQEYRGDDVFRAVERFLDSEQEFEAMRAVARIDFIRFLPYLARALRRPHQRDLCLHILYDRSKEVGLAALAAELRGLAGREPGEFRAHLEAALTAKAGPYNPFAPEAIAILLGGLP